MTTFQDLASHLKAVAGEQRAAACRLDSALAEQHQTLLVGDGIHSLRSLSARIRGDLARLARREDESQRAFTNAHLGLAPLSFAVGGLMSVLRPTQKHPAVEGLRQAKAFLHESKPFGRLAVLVDGDGIPNGVKAVSLSHLAREQGTTELAIRDALASRGYAVLWPDPFYALLQRLEEAVLEGQVRLPVCGDVLKPFLPEGAR
jgi:hypothetical protein